MKPVRRKSSSGSSKKKPGRRKESRRAELLSLAKAFRIKNRHRMTVPQLIQALESHQKKSRISKTTPLRAKPGPPPAGRAGIVPTPTAIRPKRPYDDLPWSYGETELVLMPVDPFLIHAYWDFSPGDWERVRRRRKPVVLRIHDVTMIRFDGTNSHSHFDLPVALEAQNWYVPLWSAEKSLCADLGWPRPDGSFETLVRSNVIQTARAGVSIFEETRWVDTQRARRARGGGFIRLRRWRGRREPLQIEVPRPAFWPQLEELAAGITSKAAGDLSSRVIGTKIPHKTPA
jgi:hypothetical protein